MQPTNETLNCTAHQFLGAIVAVLRENAEEGREPMMTEEAITFHLSRSYKLDSSMVLRRFKLSSLASLLQCDELASHVRFLKGPDGVVRYMPATNVQPGADRVPQKVQSYQPPRATIYNRPPPVITLRDAHFRSNDKNDRRGSPVTLEVEEGRGANTTQRGMVQPQASRVRSDDEVTIIGESTTVGRQAGRVGTATAPPAATRQVSRGGVVGSSAPHLTTVQVAKPPERHTPRAPGQIFTSPDSSEGGQSDGEDGATANHATQQRNPQQPRVQTTLPQMTQSNALGPQRRDVNYQQQMHAGERRVEPQFGADTLAEERALIWVAEEGASQAGRQQEWAGDAVYTRQHLREIEQQQGQVQTTSGRGAVNGGNFNSQNSAAPTRTNDKGREEEDRSGRRQQTQGYERFPAPSATSAEPRRDEKEARLSELAGLIERAVKYHSPRHLLFDDLVKMMEVVEPCFSQANFESFARMDHEEFFERYCKSLRVIKSGGHMHLEWTGAN